MQLIDVDSKSRAMLLERLDVSKTLSDVPLHEAVPIAARLMRRLAVPLNAGNVLSTAGLVTKRIKEFPAPWHRLGKPFYYDKLFWRELLSLLPFWRLVRAISQSMATFTTNKFS